MRRRRLLQTLATSAMLLAPASAVRAQVSVDIHIGQPPPPPIVYRVPPQPGPDFMWVEGYWYPQGKKHYKWHDGYWTRAPYDGAYWVAPYYGGGQYYAGRWEGGRGNVGHDHGWDKSKQRDEGRNPHSSKSKSK
jgi:YXWGXW repeat-containing protein